MEKNGEISFRREVLTLILRSSLQTLHSAVQSDLGLVILVHALLMLQALFGADAQCVGRDFLTIERSHEISAAIQAAADDGHSEVRAERAGRIYQFDISRIASDGKPIGTVILAFDITEQEFAERNRREFTANVSHELKTPMTTIAGFADGILDGTIPKDQEDKYLVTIADETRRLSRLVRSMLDMSRVESTGEDLTRRREFDISDRIVSTMLSFEARANDKQLDVDLQLPEDPMLVLGDPDAITRVLYNLMDNAVKFAAPGSTLCVSLWKSEGKAYVSVRDHGETIPADDLPFIFDRFHKSDRSRSLDRDGVGLGLYLVKSILDAHGEDIAVTSRDGETEFVFTLTLAKPAPKPTAKPENTGRRGGRKSS